jgi:Gpi18-like mannosyltransferase
VLLIGLAVRIILLPLFGGGDIVTNAWVSTVLIYQHQLILSNDPPPIFYVTGALLYLLHPFYSSQITTVFLTGTIFSPAQTLQSSLATNTPGINAVLAITKVPYLVADFGIALLLPRFFSNGKTAWYVTVLWWFNPISIYISYFDGQFDVVAVFFLMLALYGVFTKRPLLAVVALGVATFFSIFTVLTMPFLVVYWWRTQPTLRARFTWSTAAIVGQGIALGAIDLIYRFQAPFYQSANLALYPVDINGFYAGSTFNRGVMVQPLIGGLQTFLEGSISFRTTILLPDFIFIVVVAYGALFWLQADAQRPSVEQLMAVIAAAFLVMYATTNFLVQWAMWVQPILMIWVARNPRRLLAPYLILFATFLVYTWLDGTALVGGLFAPTWPGAASWTSPMAWLYDQGIDGTLLINVGRSIFSATALWLAYVGVRSAFWPSEPEPPVGAPPSAGTPDSGAPSEAPRVPPTETAG